MIIPGNKTSVGRVRSPRPPAARGGRARLTIRRLVVVALLVLGTSVLSFIAGVFALHEGYLTGIREKVSGSSLGNLVGALRSAPEIPVLRIDMDFRHFQKVQEQREEALRRGILVTSEDDFVPAKLTVGDATYKVDMRLKGDRTDHIRSRKWSYRIEIDGDDRLWGMRRFSIQHPITRNYHLGWLYYEHARLEGLMAPRYRFVQVVFNGTELGVYALEEHFGKEMIEANRRREGVVVRFDEAPLWVNRARGLERPPKNELAASHLETYLHAAVDAFQDGRLEKSPDLLRQRDAAISMLRELSLGERRPSEILDPERVGLHIALAELWGAPHTLSWRNMRYYYDPVSGLLEPAAFDPDVCLDWLADVVQPRGAWAIRLLRRRMLADPAVAAAYVKAHDRMSRPEYLEELKERLGEDLDGVLAVLHREWPALEWPWSKLARNQERIRASMNPSALAGAYIYRNVGGSPAGQPSIILEVSNFLMLPVELVGYRVDDCALVVPGEETVHLPPAPRHQPSIPVRLPIDDEAVLAAFRTGGPAPRVVVQTRLVGREERIPVEARILRSGTPGVRYPGVDDLVARHPFLERVGDRGLRVAPGEWAVDEDLFFPAGSELEIAPGATLRFAPDALLCCRGTLRAEGTEAAPVRLVPRDESWPGLLVEGAARRSRLRHVIIEGTRGIQRDGWSLTGGVTFLESDVTIERCRISGSSAEDLVNVIRSKMEFLDSEFGPCVSDAFDGDFVQGRIDGCSFHDVGGDAVDFSGSHVDLRGLVLRRVVDKAVSAGERTEITAVDLRIEEVGMALASKDLSHIEIHRTDVEGARIGVAAYRKKPEYGAASIEAVDLRLSGVQTRGIVQVGSSVTIDGRALPVEDVDVDLLYAQKVLGN